MTFTILMKISMTQRQRLTTLISCQINYFQITCILILWLQYIHIHGMIMYPIWCTKSAYHGKLEAARTKTRSLDFASPSICTSSSVFMRRLPSCSPLYDENNRYCNYFALSPSLSVSLSLPPSTSPILSLNVFFQYTCTHTL